MNEEIAIKQHLSKPRPYADACGCMGPQGDDPDCPCAMPWYEKVNGDWYKISEERSEDGIKLKATKLREHVGVEP
jgi:hypothetical protein